MKRFTIFILLFLSVALQAQDKVEIYQEGFNKNSGLKLSFNGEIISLNTSQSLVYEAEIEITEPTYGMVILRSGKYSGFYIEPGATQVLIMKKGYPASTEVPNSKSHEVYQAVHHAKRGKYFVAAALKYQDNPIAQEQIDTGFKFQKLKIDELKEMYADISEENKKKLPLLSAFLNTYDMDKVTIGSSIYDFTGEDRNGNIFNTEDYRGKYVLIDFASTGCGPCWAGYPDMIEITSKYDNLQVITYNEDFETEGWKNLANKRGIRLEWPVLWYGKDKAEVFEIYNVEGWPLMFLISPGGKVIDSWYGSGKSLLTNTLKKHIK